MSEVHSHHIMAANEEECSVCRMRTTLEAIARPFKPYNEHSRDVTADFLRGVARGALSEHSAHEEGT